MKFKTKFLMAQYSNLWRKILHTTSCNAFSVNKMTTLEVTTRVTGISYKCNVSSFSYQWRHNHTYLRKMLRRQCLNDFAFNEYTLKLSYVMRLFTLSLHAGTFFVIKCPCTRKFKDLKY